MASQVSPQTLGGSTAKGGAQAGAVWEQRPRGSDTAREGDTRGLVCGPHPREGG